MIQTYEHERRTTDSLYIRLLHRRAAASESAQQHPLRKNNDSKCGNCQIYKDLETT